MGIITEIIDKEKEEKQSIIWASLEKGEDISRNGTAKKRVGRPRKTSYAQIGVRPNRRKEPKPLNGTSYRTYAEAAMNRKRDESTVYDTITNLYYNA